MYYPKSQVKTNLYSNNNFAILATRELYTGPYWKNSSGKYYTGATPQDLPTQELVPSNLGPGNPSGNKWGHPHAGYCRLQQCTVRSGEKSGVRWVVSMNDLIY